jgi:hypothetical protein
MALEIFEPTRLFPSTDSCGSWYFNINSELVYNFSGIISVANYQKEDFLEKWSSYENPTLDFSKSHFTRITTACL